MVNQLIRTVYDSTIRRFLPRKPIVRNRVVVNSGRLLDFTTIDPTHKDRLIDAVRDHVRPGDTTVVVGAGWGVDSVWAARESAPSGSVMAYEAASNMVSAARETAMLNGVADRVTVNHAAIGKVRSDYGPTVGVTQIDPDELPESDVLVADCEGCERCLLNGLGSSPRVIIVECHPQYDAPVATVKKELSTLGYSATEYGKNEEYTSPMVVVGV